VAFPTRRITMIAFRLFLIATLAAAALAGSAKADGGPFPGVLHG
jgi:hypothetical protein